MYPTLDQALAAAERIACEDESDVYVFRHGQREEYATATFPQGPGRAWHHVDTVMLP